MRRLFVLIMIVMVAGYLAYPYFTLYRIGIALSSKDPKALDGYVEWPSVRDGIEMTVQMEINRRASEAQGKLAGAQSGDARTLPSPAQIRAIANKLLSTVTASQERFKLLDDIRSGRVPPTTLLQYVTYAFFTSLTDFRVDLRDPSSSELGEITVLMALREGHWLVTRILMPLSAKDISSTGQ
jgi:hypothetical protein